MNSLKTCVLLISTSLVQIACSSDSGPAAVDSENGGPVTPAVSNDTPAPDGDISHLGAITIGDDAGRAADLVGSFYRLDRDVSAQYLQSRFTSGMTYCDVQDDDVIDFEDISAGFVPSIPGVQQSAVSAGDAIVLSSPSGTYATLTEQPTAGFLFYDLPDMGMLGSDTVPQGLLVDVPGSAEISMFSAVQVPDITTLTGTGIGATDTISTSTQFVWNASEDQNSLIRIFSSTAGGFFFEDGITVTCLVPDTGSFSFPSETQAILGPDFTGASPLISRVVVNPVRSGNTMLFVIRESFES